MHLAQKSAWHYDAWFIQFIGKQNGGEREREIDRLRQTETEKQRDRDREFKENC